MRIYKDSNTGIWNIGSTVNPGACGITVVGDSVRIYALNNEKEYYYGPATNIQTLVGGSFENCVDVDDLISKLDGIGFMVDDSSSIINKFDELITSVSNSGGSTLRSFTVEITRPANQTPYGSSDVVADTTSALIPFSNVSKAIGTGVKIVRVRIQTDDTAVAGTKFNVHLYKDAPTFISDNSPFAVAYANATKRIGAIPVVMGTGNLGTVGMNDYNIAMCNPASRSIYFILETVNGFTPSANSTKFTVTIDCELSNI